MFPIKLPWKRQNDFEIILNTRCADWDHVNRIKTISATSRGVNSKVRYVFDICLFD